MYLLEDWLKDPAW